MRHRFTKAQEEVIAMELISLWQEGFSFDSIVKLKGYRQDLVRRLLGTKIMESPYQNSITPRTKFVVAKNCKIEKIAKWNFADFYEAQRLENGVIMLNICNIKNYKR